MMRRQNRLEAKIPALALIGERGIGKAVADDNFAAPESRKDDFVRRLARARRTSAAVRSSAPFR